MNNFPRTDGIYQGPISETEEGYYFRNYLRFYPDGTVISCNSPDKVGDASVWFTRKNSRKSSIYSKENELIHFSIPANIGNNQTVYSGHPLADDSIEMTIQYDNKVTTKRYEFIWFPELP